MTNNEEYKGFWFLPQNTENKIPGILYYEANKEIRLELIGGFEKELPDMFSSDSQLTEVIHGTSSNNEKITLFMCYRYGNWNLSSHYPTTNYKCYYFIKGQHINDISSETFNKVQIEFTSLYEWCPSGRISHTIEFAEDNETLETTFVLSKSDYWEKAVQIDSDFVVKISGVCGFKSSSDSKEHNLTQNTIFEVESLESKKSFSEFLNKVDMFKQFLSLATFSPVNMSEVTFFDKDDFQQLDNGKRYIHPIGFYRIEDKEAPIKYRSHQFLFTYQDIADMFPEIIKEWYSCSKNLTPIRNHLISSLEPKKVFTSLDFLIIVQSLEGYHHRFVDKSNKKIDLRNRLEELVFLFKDVDKVDKNFIELTHVVKSRNYYSHFYDKNKGVLEGKELYELTNKLRRLLICCVLSLIGFNIEKINVFLNKNQDF